MRIKTALFLIALVATLIPTGPVNAGNNRLYLGFSVLPVINSGSDLAQSGGSAKASSNNDYAVAGVLGTDTGMFRAEHEIAYRLGTDQVLGGTKSNGRFSLFTYMVNCYEEFAFGFAIKPYISAGAGYARAHADNLKLDQSNAVTGHGVAFVYQLGTGVSYDFNNYVSFDCGYKYLDTLYFAIDGKRISYTGHNVLLGARLKF